MHLLTSVTIMMMGLPVVLHVDEAMFTYCRRGQFLNKITDKCDACPGGTFMDEEHHNETKCMPCLKVRNNGRYYSVQRNCTEFKDAKVRCLNHMFFKNVGGEAHCRSCSQCSRNKDKPFTGRECTPTSDTVCCPKPKMVVREGECEDFVPRTDSWGPPTSTPTEYADAHETERRVSESSSTATTSTWLTASSTQPVSTTPTPTRQPVTRPTQDWDMYIIIGAVCAVLVLILIVIPIVIYCVYQRCKRQKSFTPVSTFDPTPQQTTEL